MGSKNDTKLKTDLNANEILMKDFKDKCRTSPSLLDCRHRLDVKQYMINILYKQATVLYPNLTFNKREINPDEDKIEANEPKLLPKKDDGCSLI